MRVERTTGSLRGKLPSVNAVNSLPVCCAKHCEAYANARRDGGGQGNQLSCWQLYSVFYGACDASRTHDRFFTRELLCQLSYTSLIQIFYSWKSFISRLKYEKQSTIVQKRQII